MIVAICGSRYWTDRRTIGSFLILFPNDTLIATGDCRGVDCLVKEICGEVGLKCVVHEADWDRYGKSAGPRRNTEILDSAQPNIVVAFHEDIENSKGTKDMLKQAKCRSIPTILITGSG